MPDLSKIPPWAWALGAVGVGAGVFLYKKHQEETAASEAASETTSETVAPEPYPYSFGQGEGAEGYGAGGGYVGGGGGAAGFSELEQGQREQSLQQQEFEKGLANEIAESERSITEILRSNQGSGSGSTLSTGSGGGAPSGGTGTVKQPAGQTPAKCPSGYLQNGNSASPATCYKITTKSMTGPKGAKATCECHTYQDGHSECQHVSNGKCVW